MKSNNVILCVLFVLLTFSAPAQLVGSIEGEIDINGAIIANGQMAQAGQVLTATGPQSMAWMNPSNYNRFQDFVISPPSPWTVPDSAEYILVEIWGAGGGGAGGGGGASGTYVKVLMEVAPNEQFNVTIGLGGAGSNTINGSGNSGSASVFQSTSNVANVISVSAGGGATNQQAGSAGAVPTGSYLSIIRMAGENGIPVSSEPATSSTDFTKYGRGGQPGGIDRQVSGKGETGYFSSPNFIYSPGTDGMQPGGGGGGGFNFNNDGGDGYIVVYW